MKIVFAGGGTGGHFYPIIAIAERVNKLVVEKKIVKCELYYFSTEPYDKSALYDNNITFKQITAGKWRRYFSINNFLDIPKIIIGIIQATIKLFLIYPDVVVGKGGYASFPTLFAARILFIPVIIHESDTHPGRVNMWAKKFAKRIAISYESAAQYFPKDKVAYTGQPVRAEIIHPQVIGAHEYFNLSSQIKTVFIIGGSSGAEKINNVVLEALPNLLAKYQVIHVVGVANEKIMKIEADAILLNNPNKDKYKILPYLNVLGMRMAAGAADLIVSRAGSMIFEIAYWQKPSIIIPISKAVSHDQESNAFNYAKAGACIVMEEQNLSASIFYGEIDRILTHTEITTAMEEGTKKFAKQDGALVIAEEIINIAISHEK